MYTNLFIILILCSVAVPQKKYDYLFIPKTLKMVITASLCDAPHINEFELGK